LEHQQEKIIYSQ